MKKLFLIAAAAMFAFSVSAQTVTTASPLVGGTYGNQLDTVTNTASVKKYLIVRYSNSTLAIQAVATKLTGTMGGYAFPIASNDGVNFKSIAASSADTVTWTTAAGAQTFLWTYPKTNSTTTFAPYLYYGVQFTGAGTMTATFKGNLVGRQED